MLQKYQTRAKKLVTNTYVVEAKGNDSAEEILQTINKVGNRGINKTNGLLGSVSYKVSHYAKCPVLIVR
jgi:nucleotide-binding universal stress UspA family protein